MITQILNAAGFQPTIQQQSWVTINGNSLGHHGYLDRHRFRREENYRPD